MPDHRPSPDELLARVQAAEASQTRGRLKIFFGAAPGVGKTYAMLEAGRKQAREGRDVVVGYIEPHARPETQALVLGLDVLARREIDYRGARLLEFDLAAALERKPQLLLVDELAHTNAPGSLHAKRWQDARALVEAGIDVFTTMNVQHLESVNDVVAQITGVVVRETVPDSVFEEADEIELVDLAPDDLIERLREGKIYVAKQASRAIDNFFQKGNLIALRELALRATADRVDAQMTAFRQEHAIQRTWPAGERLLVCVSASPLSPKLVRAARRLAASMRCPWTAAYVETMTGRAATPRDTERLAQTLNLAQQLGGETVTLSGPDLVEEIIRYARAHNVTRIIVGKPQQSRWREILLGSRVFELTRRSGDIDVHFISGEDSPAAAIDAPRLSQREQRPLAYLASAGVVAACTAASAVMYARDFDLANLIMAYLLGVIVVASWLGRGESILAAVLSVAAFDFFFVPPRFTFAVSDVQFAFTFAVMLLTGFVISTLTGRVRFQTQVARDREQRTAALYALSQDLLDATSLEEIAAAAARRLTAVFRSAVFLLMPDETAPRAPLKPLRTDDSPGELEESEMAVAQWVFDHGERAGRGAGTLPSAKSLCVPLRAKHRIAGVLALRPMDDRSWGVWTPEQLRLLDTFAGQLAQTAERIDASRQAQRARLLVETERLRHSLFSAISHDLRTPLATIMGASSVLSEDEPLPDASRLELARSIYGESQRLSRLVSNLLEMTRLESGAMQVRKEWQPIEEVIGSVLNRLSIELRDRPTSTRIEPGLPLVPIDQLLIEQVLVNLLENAVKHTPPGSPIEIGASAEGETVTIEVADRGPGVPAADLERIFDKFYQLKVAGARRGVGLGLAICRGIVELHGGRIWAAPREGGGLSVRFTLPPDGSPPKILSEEAAAR